MTSVFLEVTQYLSKKYACLSICGGFVRRLTGESRVRLEWVLSRWPQNHNISGL